MTDNASFSSPVKHTWEANMHREKGIQPIKEVFISQKRNFSDAIVSKACMKKVLEYQSLEELMESKNPRKSRIYTINFREVLLH